MMPRPIQGLAFFILVTMSVSCSQQQADVSVSKRVISLTEQMARLTPTGWTLYDKVLHFTADSLYEQINGRAEFYLAYDVICMDYASYEKLNDPAKFMTLSVYDMGNPTDAFGVFAGERSSDEQSIDLGRDAYQSGGNYYIWLGQYYIQVVTSDESDELQQTALSIAQELTNALHDSGETVWGLKALPPNGLVQDSIRYFKVDAMGLDFMPETYLAQYTTSGQSVTVFLSRCETESDAQLVVSLYVNFAKQYGISVTSRSLEDSELIICDMGKNVDIVSLSKNLVVGVTAEEDEDKALQTALDVLQQLDSNTN